MRRIPFRQLHTLRDLARRTRLPRDTLQRWGNIGVLIAEGDSAHGGRGVHRRFQASEMAIAILLRPFVKVDMPTGQLLRLSGVLRTALGLAPGSVRGIHYEEGAPEIRRALLRGAYGGGDSFLIVSFTETAVRIEPVTSEADEPVLWDLSSFFRTADMEQAEAAIVINLATLRGVLGDPPFEQ
jgi:hypothetical protein